MDPDRTEDQRLRRDGWMQLIGDPKFHLSDRICEIFEVSKQITQQVHIPEL